MNEAREASKQFYAALTRVVNGDVGPMTEIWSHAEDGSVMHPTGTRHLGWNEIDRSWRAVARIATEGQIDLIEQVLHLHGETAWESGIEQGRSRLADREISFENRVTNIYRRENGGWKIVHHHADVSPRLREIVEETGSEID